MQNLDEVVDVMPRIERCAASFSDGRPSLRRAFLGMFCFWMGRDDYGEGFGRLAKKLFPRRYCCS